MWGFGSGKEVICDGEEVDQALVEISVPPCSTIFS